MKLVEVIGTTVLSLTLGLAASAYAQEQHDQKEEEKAKPAQQDEKKASPDKPSKTEKKAAEKQKDNAGHEEKATQQPNKDAKPEQTNERQQINERQKPQHAEQAQPEQGTKGGGDHGGGRIPEDRYRAHFGQEHKFHVNQADYGRDRRFQYSGYTFGFVDEWPSNWLYTEDVFVIEIDDVYYLCNPTYPGVNIALRVVL